MSRTLSVALIGDGKTDEMLWPIVRWSLQDRYGDELPLRFTGFVNRAARRPRIAVDEVIRRFAPELIVFHRDAEGQDPQIRREEIPDLVDVVPVVPVRMTEAWLLIDAAAIANAADNPNFSGLKMPELDRLEHIPDPKSVLESLLVQASDLAGPRRRKRFSRDLTARVGAVADYIESYAPLRALSAFVRFEADLHGWVDRWLGAASETPRSRRLGRS